MVEINPFPALFIGHGSPFNIKIREGKYYKSLQKFVSSIEKPESIIVLSAHWETDKVEITSWDEHEPYVEEDEESLIPLIKKSYIGNPSLSRSIAYTFKKKGISSKINSDRGIDSAVWCPYSLMFNDADIPIIQLSLPADRRPKALYKLGLSLINFRKENILIMGSGNIVYSKKIMHKEKDAPVSGWAKDFDDFIEEHLFVSIDNLFKYSDTAPNALYAVATTEHIDPMFFILGSKFENEKIRTIYEGFEYSTTSMRSFEIR